MTYVTIQISVKCISYMAKWNKIYLFTYDNFFMVLSCIKNSWQYWRPLPDSVMTFLSQYIIF